MHVAAYLVPANLLGADEIIILAIKPSNWFVLLASLPVAASGAVVAAVAFVVNLHHAPTPLRMIAYACAAAALLRMVAACWQWLGRTYVLTNLRIVCVRGLIGPAVTDVPLTRVRHVDLLAPLPERIVGVGTIACRTGGDDPPAVVWHAVGNPDEIHRIVHDAVGRAHRRNDMPGD